MALFPLYKLSPKQKQSLLGTAIVSEVPQSSCKGKRCSVLSGTLIIIINAEYT